MLGEARQPDADQRRARGRRRARWPRRCARRPQQAGRRDRATLAGVGVGSPGDADEKTGVVSGARNLPGWEGSFPLGETLAGGARHRGRLGNDVQVATEAEFHLGAGQRVPQPARRLLGHRRRRRPRPRRQALARPRRRRRDRPHGGQARRRQVPLRAPRLHGGLRRAARRWRPRRAASTKRARRPTSSSSWRSTAATALTSGIWERALDARRPARREADRPRDRGARHRRSPRRSTCSTSRR